MAISRDKKNSLVAELTDLFANAKGAVGAIYTGLNVADMQALRQEARNNDITIKVVKNRLVKVALQGSDKFKTAETSNLSGQLVYAFSNQDEVAPAQVLAKFQKSHPDLKLVIGFDAAGNTLDTNTVIAISNLPTKDQLRGQLVSVIAAPLSGFMSVVSGNQRGLVQVIAQRAKSL